MNLKKCLLTKNDCYKKATKMTPKGIVVHSTGANNPNLKRYVQPDDGLLGNNTNNNSWNRSGIETCVHAFIGKDKNGDVQVYQTLPFNYACWGVGKGSKGSYNYNPTGHIQFEICEDNLKDENYFNKVFNLAAEFCAYLCKEYNLSVNTIVSHHEAHEKGYASNHADCDHWLKKFGKDMDWFRNEVKKKLNGSTSDTTENETDYLVVINSPDGSLNVRDGAGTNYKINEVVKNGEVFTIVEEKDGWGRLKSGAGWISLNYTKKKDSTSSINTNITKYVYNCDSLNIRKGAGTSYAAINDLAVGTKVTVYETKSGWSRIGTNQWVSDKYLTTTKPNKVYSTKQVTNADGGLNVRSSNKFTGSSNLCKSKSPLPNGTLVSIIETKGSGVRIGTNRWVYKQYLK